MNLLPVKVEDFEFDDCGRMVPPAGYMFVDLYRMIPFFSNNPGTVEALPAPSFSGRVMNNAKTLFIVMALQNNNSAARFRIKWPSGLFFQRKYSGDRNSSGVCFPTGVAGNALSMGNAPQYIGPGEKITIEILGPGGPCSLQFVGVLRYLVASSEMASGPASACLVGYPVRSSGGDVAMEKSLLSMLEERPRYYCAAANIQATEVMLSNQCREMDSEPFSQFSDSYTPPLNETFDSRSVIWNGSEDFILREWRPKVTGDNTTNANSLVGIRLPNGYSLTGGDLIPVNRLKRVPVFPRIRMRSGDRLILDISNSGATITTTPPTLQIEFLGVKAKRQTLAPASDWETVNA